MLNETNAAATVATTEAPVVVADATAKPAKPKRAAKPKAAKPAPAPKPLPTPANKQADADAEAKRCQALRDTAARYYNQASLAAHQRKPASRDAYLSRVAKPVQRIGGSGPSTRDESGLALILSGADKTGAFDPCAINLDLGIASRLASVGFLALNSGNEAKPLTLTKAGRERANLVVKRAA